MSRELDRREFGKWMAGTAITVGGVKGFKDHLISGDDEHFQYVNRAELRENFVDVPDDDPLALAYLQPPERRYLQSQEQRSTFYSDYATRVEFEVEDETRPVELILPSAPRDNVYLTPMQLTIDDDLEILLPHIQSFRPTEGSTLLGELAEGRHTATIKATPAPNGVSEKFILEPLVIQNYGTPALDEMYRRQMMYAVRPNNLFRLYNDLDLLHFYKLSRNSLLQRAAATEVALLSSEDGGMKPENRQERYGRTPDAEAVSDRFGDILAVNVVADDPQVRILLSDDPGDFIVQVPINGTGHAWATFAGQYYNDTDHSMAQIKSANNLMGFRLQSGLFFFPPPHFVASDIDEMGMLNLNPEIMIVGLREEGRSIIRRRLRNASELTDQVLAGLRESPKGVYPTFPQEI